MASELPKKAAMAISRIRPKTRLNKMKKPTTPVERMIFFLSNLHAPGVWPFFTGVAGDVGPPFVLLALAGGLT